jgi:hypothetical protein
MRYDADLTEVLVERPEAVNGLEPYADLAHVHRDQGGAD